MSSEEQANTLRLIRLLNVGGTDALRDVFDAKFPPATLAASLRPLHTTLQTLLRKKVLNLSQWDKLYPAVPGTPDSKTFDISLLYALLRSICGFKSPKHPLWTSNPLAADRSVEANIARVRWYRNDVIHNLASGVDDVTFQNYWTDICSALKDLGIPQAELDALKDSHLDEKKYTDMLLEWKREDQLLQQKVDETLTEVEDMKQMLRKEEGTKESVCEIRDELQQVKREVKGTTDEVKAVKQMMSEGQETTKEEVLRKLAKINFNQEMKSQAKKCHPGTREWLFSKVEDWFRDEESESRVMIILGDPGMGKTVVAATVCQRMQTSGNLGGMHFCIHGNKRYMNAKLMLQSLANNLCNVLPAYKTALIDLLSHNLGEDQDLGKMNVEELFCFLLQEPLSEVPAPKEPFLFVIDALDEADYHGRNELMDVMSSYFARLPPWLKFLVTSRSDVNAKSKLEDLCPLEITPDHERNVEDLELFLREKLQAFVPAEWLDATLSSCLKKSQGQMLYAFCTIEYLSKHTNIYWEYLDNVLPDKISSWYKHYTDCLKQDLGVTDAVFSRFLAALVASREPLPVEIIPLLLKLEAEEDQRIVRSIEAVSSLLPLCEEKVHVFHKSFTDWLIEPQPYTYGKPRAYVTERQGHQVLREVCSEVLESLKSKTELLKDNDISLSESYALKHGMQHDVLQIEGSGNQNVQLKNLAIDLEFLLLRLIYGSVYDVIEEYDVWEGKMSPDATPKVEEIKYILRGNSSILSARPQNILEHIVNEAECEELIAQAHELLHKEKYQHTWMEVINRKIGDKTNILAELEVGKPIHQFEVSPDGKMLAVNAEYEGSRSSGFEELSLWLITSGKLMWRKKITVSENMQYYRCCTFSPDGNLILFGRLDQVCHILDGEFWQYFNKNNHEYFNCQFSHDGKMLLTQPKPDCLILWDVDKQLQLHVLFVGNSTHNRFGTVQCHVKDFKFSLCGQYIVFVSYFEIFLWDSSTGIKLDSIKLDGMSLWWHLDWVCPPSGGHHLFLSSSLKRLIFKISSSQLVKCHQDFDATVEFIFSRDGKHGTAIIDTVKDECFNNNVNDQLSCCPISVGSLLGYGNCKFVDERSVIVERKRDCSKLKTLQVVRTSERAEHTGTCSIASQENSCIYTCAFSEDGTRLYTIEHTADRFPDGVPQVFVYNTNQMQGGHLQKRATTGIDAVFLFVLTSGKVLVFYNYCKCEVWDSDLEKLLWTWECKQDARPLCAAEEVGVFMGGRSGEVIVCDVQTGNVKFTLEGHNEQVHKGWIDHQNSCLLTTDILSSVILWDVDSHKPKECYTFVAKMVRDCSFASEKQLVAVLLNDDVYILDKSSREIIKWLNHLSVCRICFVHGTSLLAFVGHTSLFVVDISTSDEKLAVVRFMKPNKFQFGLCYSRESRKFTVTGSGGILLVELHNSPSIGESTSTAIVT